MNTISRNTLILFIILNLDVSSQITEYKNNLNGEVKRIIINTAYMTGIIKDYNRNGLLKRECIYNGNTFNKDSLFSKNKFTYKFDKKNRISEILITNKDKDKYKKVFKYKSSYYTIKDLCKENSNWVSCSYNNNLTKFTNNHQEYKTIKVLEMGMFHEYYKWNKDKTLLLQIRFETDKKDWNEYICNYTYNDQSLLIYKEYKTQTDPLSDINCDGSIFNPIIIQRNSFNTKYKYDKYNNCIEEKIIHHNGSICLKTYVFKYDNQDNWVHKKEYVDGILQHSETRNIIYF